MINKEEENKISDLWASACHCLCNGDWENYEKCWSHNSRSQLIHADEGEWLKGWEEIAAKYKKMFRSGLRCRISKNELVLNVSPSADMAWGTVDIILTFNDTAHTQIDLWETLIFEKIRGDWKLVHGMASIPRNLDE